VTAENLQTDSEHKRSTEQEPARLLPRLVAWRTLVPAVVVIVGVVAGFWLAQSWLLRLLIFAGAMTCALVVAEWQLRRRLHVLVDDARSLLDEDPGHDERARASDRLASLLALQAPLEQQMKREQNLLRAEAQRRTRAEEELRETEERYTLAVGGASDGMWEWSTGSDSAYFSPRWKSMLGCAEAEIGERIDEWHSRIHPEDRARVMQSLQSHLDGHTPRFEDEHRLRHKDGGWRWVLARAAAVRHASGRAYRVVGLNLDISARRQAQEVLVELADGMHGLQGEAAYTALVRKFVSILDMQEAFLCECCDDPPTRVRMLAHWQGDELAPCSEFDLTGTPCCEVIVSAKSVFAGSGAGERWPAARREGVDSYLGLPCFDTKGNVIGHLACIGRKPMLGELPHDAVLRLFAVRASVEMERRILERLRERNADLPPASIFQ
jgi:PAS domain S-box-containing protein